MTRNIISLGICVLGMVMCIVALVWVYESPEEIAQKLLDIQKTYERSGYRNSFADAGVPADEYEECLRWAFGDDILGVERRLWPARWNERHSDIFTMLGSDECRESLMKAGRAYCNRPQVITIEDGEDFSIIEGNYIDEDGKVVLGREGSTITSPLFELDDGTTLAEAELDWGTVDLSDSNDSSIYNDNWIDWGAVDLSDVEFDSNGIKIIGGDGISIIDCNFVELERN